MKDPTYLTLHKWMNRTHPRTGRCEHCNSTEKPTEYASIGHTYTRNRADWLELCRPCHLAFDGVTGRERTPETVAKIVATKQAHAPTHCKNGHPFDEANTYLRPRGGRDCRTCMAERVRRHRAAA